MTLTPFMEQGGQHGARNLPLNKLPPRASHHSGRSPHWIKSKNPASATVAREAEGEWGR